MSPMNPTSGIDTLEITQEERDLLVSLLRKAPLQGNLETLPAALDRLVRLVMKLEGLFTEEEDGESSARHSE